MNIFDNMLELKTEQEIDLLRSILQQAIDEEQDNVESDQERIRLIKKFLKRIGQ